MKGEQNRLMGQPTCEFAKDRNETLARDAQRRYPGESSSAKPELNASEVLDSFSQAWPKKNGAQYQPYTAEVGTIVLLDIISPHMLTCYTYALRHSLSNDGYYVLP